MMKPIHKFNGGIGATLCHRCHVIITTGMTDDLYCEKHKPKPMTEETREQLRKVGEAIKGKELFKESNRRAKEILGGIKDWSFLDRKK